MNLQEELWSNDMRIHKSHKGHHEFLTKVKVQYPDLIRKWSLATNLPY